MQTKTTRSVEDKSIIDCRGIVAAEAIPGANLPEDLFAGIRPPVGGRSGRVE